MVRSRVLLVLAAGALLLSPAISQATFSVRIQTTGSNAVDTTINDDDNDGVIGLDANYGAFQLSSVAGTSNSAPPTVPAILSLTGTHIQRRGGANSGGAGNQTITITLTDTNFVVPSGIKDLLTHLDGSLTSSGSSVTLQAFVENQGGDILNLGDPDSLQEAFFGATNGDPFTFKLVLTVTLTDASDSKFTSPDARAELSNNGTTNPVPAPGGLIMLAGAVPFFGLLRRKLRKGEPTVA